MNKRAYILLNTKEGKAELVAKALDGMPGIVMADPVEGGPPNVILVVEDPEWVKVAEKAVQAVGFVESMTVDLRLLPSKQSWIQDVISEECFS